MTVNATVNGTETTLSTGEPDLARALRAAGYMGVKCGSETGECGASTVLVDGSPVPAQSLAVEEVDGKEIETISALGTQDDLHPIQQAFVDHFAVQCGFCIPGMIMRSKALLSENPDPSESEVREALDHHVCRCTGYQKPVEAVLDAADRMSSRAVADGGERND